MDQTTIWTNNLKARSEPGLCPDFITVCNEITLKKKKFHQSSVGHADQKATTPQGKYQRSPFFIWNFSPPFLLVTGAICPNTRTNLAREHSIERHITPHIAFSIQGKSELTAERYKGESHLES
jgi:hypothetical protein